MRTILRSQHNNDRRHAGKVFEGFDIDGEWLAVHFNDGTTLLFEASVQYDDEVDIDYQNSPPSRKSTQYGLHLIDREEFDRYLAEKDERERESRRTQFELLKAEFEPPVIAKESEAGE